jgi:glyoxylase-like metal-dependent hydrolase (beta-lactamase superfamily II)
MGTPIITPLNIGDLRFDLSDIYPLPADHPFFEHIAEVPMYCYHISIPGRSVLVDAVAYDLEHITEPYRIPRYEPPAPLLEQLSAQGIDAEQVSDVIITHAHSDHYGGLCVELNGHNQLSFPKALHYLNAADWKSENFGQLEQRTLRIVEQEGSLKLTEGEVDLGDGLVIIPMPGETPGHQILLFRDEEGDQNFYFAGDLYHHQIELSDEKINPEWVDLNEMQLSKTALKRRIASDGGIVYFTHIPGSFRVVEGEIEQLVWEEL